MTEGTVADTHGELRKTCKFLIKKELKSVSFHCHAEGVKMASKVFGKKIIIRLERCINPVSKKEGEDGIAHTLDVCRVTAISLEPQEGDREEGGGGGGWEPALCLPL